MLQTSLVQHATQVFIFTQSFLSKLRNICLNLFPPIQGFIEELGQAQPPPPPLTDDDDDDEPYDLGQVLGPLEALLPGLLGGGARGFGGGIPRGAGLGGPMRPRQHRIRIARGAPARPGGPQNLGMDQAALENALQVDFLYN